MLHFTDWNLIPHFLAHLPSLELRCVFRAINQKIAVTVISEQTNLRFYSNHDAIYIQGKQEWTESSALRHTRQNRCPLRFCSIDYNPYLLLHRNECINLCKGLLGSPKHINSQWKTLFMRQPNDPLVFLFVFFKKLILVSPGIFSTLPEGEKDLFEIWLGRNVFKLTKRHIMMLIVLRLILEDNKMEIYRSTH